MPKQVTLSYKFKAEPTIDQSNTLKSWTGTCRFLYNLALEHRKVSWNQFRKSENYYTQALEIKNLKKCEGFEWISEVPNHCLQQTLKDLDTAFKRFFKLESGFPDWRKAKGRQSIRFPDPNQFKIERINGKFGILHLPKNMSLKFRMSRGIEGEVRNVTIMLEKGCWYVSFCCIRSVKTTSSKDSKVGVDRGIIDSVVCSDGVVYNMPKSTIAQLKRIGVLQRRLRNKSRLSKNWSKQQYKIKKKYRKVANIRNDFIHKTSTILANNHGLIVLEDLNIKGMTKTAKGTLENPGTGVKLKSTLNREILNQSWGSLERMLYYKAVINGGSLLFVSPKDTSRTCPNCGHVDSDNRVGKRFSCVKCSYTSDADLVGALNILAKYTAGQAGSACGGVNISSTYEARTDKRRNLRKSKLKIQPHKKGMVDVKMCVEQNSNIRNNKRHLE